MSSLVKAHEFFGQMQAANQSFRLIDTNIGAEQNLFSGTFFKRRVRNGLGLQYSDVTHLCDLETKTEAPPHLGIKLFFEGGVAASIGDLSIPMPARRARGGWQPSATFFHQKEQELFQRRADAGVRVRKLTIKILPEWLDDGDVFGDGRATGLRRFTQEKLAARSWSPSRALLAAAEDITRPTVLDPHLAMLHVESRILGIIAEAFSLLLQDAGDAHTIKALSTMEVRRLKRAEDLLHEMTGTPGMEEIAQKVGVSVNTLQRLFHAGHGTSVFHYLRKIRLERARAALEQDGISTAEAAYIAGYGSAANFSTAFKRQFGMTPKESRR